MYVQPRLRNWAIGSFALVLAACSEGADGGDGVDGSMGPQGEKGIPGAKGDHGDPGPQGDTGATGAKGAQGDAGPMGAQGDAGPMGAQGDAGPMGAQGDAGPMGAQGDAGPMGPVGATGSLSNHYLYAIGNGTSARMVPNGEFLNFNEVIRSDGFSYDSLTGLFTVLVPGIYHFDVKLDVDDGNVLSTPNEYFFDLAGVARPSDSLMNCNILVPDATNTCTASYLMQFDTPGQTFALRNTGQDAYAGTYEGNPFVNVYRMAVLQID